MGNRNYAPVILFTYNRPEHTQKVLDALALNNLAKDSDLIIFLDGPKKNSVEANQRTKEVIEKEKELGRFKSVDIRISNVNKGLAKSIISGVTSIIEENGRCIVLEDDHITSKYFLTFMNNSLDFYEYNENIWSISGFTYPLKSLEKYSHDIYLSYRACSHGWATWSNRWEKVDWEVSDYKELKRSFLKKRKFNRGGNDLFRMLQHQMRGERDSWAIRFCYAQSKHDMLTVYPKKTLVENIGFDGSGTHCQNDSKRNKQIFVDDTTALKLEDVVINKRVIKDFKRRFNITVPELFKWIFGKIFRRQR